MEQRRSIWRIQASVDCALRTSGLDTLLACGRLVIGLPSGTAHFGLPTTNRRSPEVENPVPKKKKLAFSFLETVNFMQALA
jgi:hypothetical protein